MINNDFVKEQVISNFISLNPTGIITLSPSGTFKMNGPPDKIMTPAENSKQNLNNVSSNKFICDQNTEKIENFTNYYLYGKTNNNNNLINKSNISIYLFIFIILLLTIFYLKKKKFI